MDAQLAYTSSPAGPPAELIDGGNYSEKTHHKIQVEAKMSCAVSVEGFQQRLLAKP